MIEGEDVGGCDRRRGRDRGCFHLQGLAPGNGWTVMDISCT